MIGLNVILVLGSIFLVVGQSNFDDQISISQPTSTPTWISDPTQDPNLPFMSIPRPAGPIQNMNAPIEPDQVTMDPRISQNTINLQSSNLSPNEQTAGGGPKITSLNYGGPFQSPGLPGTSFGYPGPSQYPGQYSGGGYGLPGQYGGYGLPGQYGGGGYGLPGQYSGGSCGTPRIEIPIPCPRFEIPIIQCPVYQYQCPSPCQRF